VPRRFAAARRGSFLSLAAKRAGFSPKAKKHRIMGLYATPIKIQVAEIKSCTIEGG
jgi:hypothetical protein